MTQLLEKRAAERDDGGAVPSHPHYTLGTLIALGIVGTLVAIGIGVAALMITASRNSVDDALVAEKVDTFLAAEGATDLPEDVLPALVPKGQLAPVPADDEADVRTSAASATPPSRCARVCGRSISSMRPCARVISAPARFPLSTVDT